MPILNIAAYRFVSLADPASWVVPLQERCAALALKGTILVADEGINCFLAGDAQAVDAFLSWLAGDPRFIDHEGRPALLELDVKRSWSEAQPFRRLRVRHKAEIVTMRRPTIRPGGRRATPLAPRRLAAWLAQGHDDDGRPFHLLDTRNAFEVAHGTFDGAVGLGLAKFDSFPQAIDLLRDEWRDRTIVTFCTGGIRCEKAALYMEEIGFSRVMQLDGGILGYFEAVGGANFRGDCFVFDERVTLNAELSPRKRLGALEDCERE